MAKFPKFVRYLFGIEVIHLMIPSRYPLWNWAVCANILHVYNDKYFISGSEMIRKQNRKYSAISG